MREPTPRAPWGWVTRPRTRSGPTAEGLMVVVGEAPHLALALRTGWREGSAGAHAARLGERCHERGARPWIDLESALVCIRARGTLPLGRPLRRRAAAPHSPGTREYPRVRTSRKRARRQPRRHPRSVAILPEQSPAQRIGGMPGGHPPRRARRLPGRTPLASPPSNTDFGLADEEQAWRSSHVASFASFWQQVSAAAMARPRLCQSLRTAYGI